MNQNLWTKLCGVMGCPEFAEDPRYNTNAKRCDNLKDVIQIIEGWLKRLDDIGEAERRLMEAGVPCAKVYSPEDAFQDPHFNT